MIFYEVKYVLELSFSQIHFINIFNIYSVNVMSQDLSCFIIYP